MDIFITIANIFILVASFIYALKILYVGRRYKLWLKVINKIGFEAYKQAFNFNGMPKQEDPEFIKAKWIMRTVFVIEIAKTFYNPLFTYSLLVWSIIIVMHENGIFYRKHYFKQANNRK